jgi:hypothetical protein
MKFQAIFIAALSATGLASPIPEADATKPKLVPLYTLRLSSRTPSLDGKLLSLSNTTLGIFPSAPSPKFYPVRNPQTGLSELHSTSSKTTTLALVGTHGLLDLSALPDPAAVTVPTGTTLDWQNFDLSEDDTAGSLTYAGSNKQGGWVAFPTGKGQGEWAVKWKDTTATTIQNYIPVKVVYEVAEGL